jgi:hypothetical protein
LAAGSFFTTQRLDCSNLHIQAAMLPAGSFSNKQQLVDVNQGAEHYEKEFLGQKCSKV